MQHKFFVLLNHLCLECSSFLCTIDVLTVIFNCVNWSSTLAPNRKIICAVNIGPMSITGLEFDKEDEEQVQQNEPSKQWTYRVPRKMLTVCSRLGNTADTELVVRTVLQIPILDGSTMKLMKHMMSLTSFLNNYNCICPRWRFTSYLVL